MVLSQELLTRHKMLAADFLEANFDKVFTHYQKLLHSDNYVTRRQSLKLLGELLLDRHNFSVSLIILSCLVSVTTFNSFLVSGDDAIHFEPRQPQAHDEHAEGEVEKHPVRGLPRFQGEEMKTCNS